VITHAEDPQHVPESRLPGEVQQMVRHVGCDVAVVPDGVIVIRQHATSILALPPVEAMAGASPVVVVATDPGAPQDSGHSPRMPEGVRLPVNLHCIVGDPKVLTEPPTAVEQMAA